VVAVGISFGGMHGYAINPRARSRAAIFAVLAGFKNNGLTDGTGVWLVPVIGPLVGGAVGALVYVSLIGRRVAAGECGGETADGMDPTHRAAQ